MTPTPDLNGLSADALDVLTAMEEEPNGVAYFLDSEQADSLIVEVGSRQFHRPGDTRAQWESVRRELVSRGLARSEGVTLVITERGRLAIRSMHSK
jgi:hypothetical protein